MKILILFLCIYSVNIFAQSTGYFANTTAPNGYLECNGQAVNRSIYAELFAAIGTVYGIGDGLSTFNVPDLRGEFIRGVSTGRAGVDVGRIIGTAQTDDFKSHTHDYDNLQGGGVANSVSDTIATSADTTTQTGHVTGTSGGTETRPRNVAMLPCIKF
jgi:microcystin-dependent protein